MTTPTSGDGDPRSGVEPGGDPGPAGGTEPGQHQDAPTGQGDANFDPFRFGRPEPGSPAAAAYPHLFPPPTPGTGLGYAPPGTDPAAGPGPNYNHPLSAYPPPNYPPGSARYPGTGSPGAGHPGAGYPAQPYGYPTGPGPAVGASNGKAVAGFVLGIASVLLFFTTFLDVVVIVLGLVFSILGLQAARRGNKHRGLAIAGLVLSAVAAVIVIIFTTWLLQRVHHCEQLHDQGSRAYNRCIVDI